MKRLNRIAIKSPEAEKEILGGTVITVKRIEWDTDGEDVDLPEVVYIDLDDLLYDGETEEILDDCEEIYDRIADYLSDNYGFCMFNFDVDGI